MVSFGQDNVLGSGNLARKRGKLKEKCQTLEWKNSRVGRN